MDLSDGEAGNKVQIQIQFINKAKISIRILMIQQFSLAIIPFLCFFIYLRELTLTKVYLHFNINRAFVPTVS